MRVTSWLWRARRCPLRAPLRNAARMPNPAKANTAMSTAPGVWLIGAHPRPRGWPADRCRWAVRAAESGQ